MKARLQDMNDAKWGTRLPLTLPHCLPSMLRSLTIRPVGRLLIVERAEQLVISARRSIESPLFPKV
jgi:hypothetical protein